MPYSRFVFAAAFAVALSASLQAQTPASSTPPPPADSSQAPTPPAQPTPAQPTPVPANGAYISSDPLALVKYDNKWDLSVGLAFGHIHAGPNLREGANLGGLDVSGTYWLGKRLSVEASGRGYLGTSGAAPNSDNLDGLFVAQYMFLAGPNLREGANLGGLDVSGTYWLGKRLGVEASGRGYLGTSGAAPNSDNLDGLFVAQYMFLAGPEYLGPHNKHGALIMHALVGGAYGDFNTDLRGNTPGPSGPAAFYTNQTAFAGAFGGHIDLNRSPQWVFRITPDALMTTYDGGSGSPHTQWNFGISVGAEYKFKKKR